jgi:DNA-binding transcriptional ArsR family regulator
MLFMALDKENGVCADLTIEDLQEAARMLRLLAHPHRLKIIDLLEPEPDGLAVNTLVARLGIAQSAVSQHLSSMQRAGLIKGNRRGKQVWYHIDNPKPLQILTCIRKRKAQS